MAEPRTRASHLFDLSLGSALRFYALVICNDDAEPSARTSERRLRSVIRRGILTPDWSAPLAVDRVRLLF